MYDSYKMAKDFICIINGHETGAGNWLKENMFCHLGNVSEAITVQTYYEVSAVRTWICVLSSGPFRLFLFFLQLVCECSERLRIWYELTKSKTLLIIGYWQHASIVIVNSEFSKALLKAKRTRALAYSRALHQMSVWGSGPVIVGLIVFFSKGLSRG